jgi:predicted phosphodiesterase
MEEIKGLVDFVIEVPSDKEATILQLTDTQILDESKKRYESRVSGNTELTNEDAYRRCFKYIKGAVEQSNPDLILITGDFIYGEFDDDGEWFSKLVLYMNSLEIPWAPIFGNHDNESMMGVTWQCNLFENFEENSAYFEEAFGEFKGLYPEFDKFESLSNMKNYCLFKRGDITGNGNYSIGIVQDKQLIKTVYMMDTNACKYAYSDKRIIDENGNTVTITYNQTEVDENGNPTIKTTTGFGADQVEWLNTSSANIDATLGYTVTKFLGIHIQLNQFWYAAIESGYENDDGDSSNENDYKIGETVTAKNGDFGAKGEKFNGLHGDEALWQILKDNNFDGVFAGHTHKNSTSILYDGIRLTFGLKTGTFDAHSKDSLGGTQITLNGNGFKVEHVYVK